MVKYVTIPALLPLALRDYSCHVLILEDRFGKHSCADWTRKILSEYPGIKIMVLTSLTDPLQIHQLEKAGGKGFVHNSTDGMEIKTGLFKMMAGIFYLCPLNAGAMAGKKTRTGEAEETLNDPGFCPREKEALLYMLQRMKIKEMAELFGVGMQTIKNYRSKVISKVVAAGYKDLKDYGKKAGLIE